MSLLRLPAPLDPPRLPSPSHADDDHLPESCADCPHHLSFHPPLPAHDTPDLTNTPLSCASSDSLPATMPPFPIPDFDFAPYYLPDLAAMDACQPLHMVQDHHNPRSLFPFRWMNHPSDEPFTIHSPTPIFAYNTFQFDLDRIQSPQLLDPGAPSETAALSRSKRRREHDDLPHDPSSPKKRRVFSDPPDPCQMFAEPFSPISWRRQSFYDAESSPDPLAAFSNKMRSPWDDVVWPTYCST